MERDPTPDKITAIYELRAAVEAKVHAEQALRSEPSPEHRDALLDASLNVEAKTQDAIEACLDCGHEHGPGDPHHGHGRVEERHDNVTTVDFRPAAERDGS